MEVVFLNRYLTDPPLIHPARFVLEFFKADDYFASKNSFPIFRNPHQVVLKPMLGMSTLAVSSHSQIMPDFPPLRQLRWLRFGCHSSPGLKAWGFLA